MKNRSFSQLNLSKYLSSFLSNSIILLIIIFYLYAFTLPALAQNTTGNQKMVSNIEEELLKPDFDKEYEFLKEQTKEFREFIERERKHHQEFLQWSIYVAGIIITVATVIFGLLGIKTINDAKKRISSYVREKFNEYIDENTGKIKITIDHIAEKVIQEKLNLKKNICFLVPSTLQQEVENSEVAILRKRGFKNIEVKNTDEPVDDNSDLVIFYFDKSQQEKLTNLVSLLENNPRPLIVYYKGRVENKALKKYKWHLFANTPLTLVNWVFTTLNSFKPLK